MSNEEIVGLLENMENQSKALRDDILRICWYMRGSVSYDEAMMLSKTDRDVIGKIIKENLEITQKSKIPFF